MVITCATGRRLGVQTQFFGPAFIYKLDEDWLDGAGRPFRQGTFYNVGGSSKLYGAVLARCRKYDFLEVRPCEGASEKLEPGIRRQRYFILFDASPEKIPPTEPFDSELYWFPSIPDEAPIAAVRRRLTSLELRPSPLPLAVDLPVCVARRALSGAVSSDRLGQVGR